MYINDVHIIFYILAILIGSITGRSIEWAKDRLSEHKKVITKEYFTKRKKINKFSIILMIINSVLNVVILYKYGIQEIFIENLELIKYLILTPILLVVFVIDYKHKIIPNRLNITIFEIGIIIAFIYGMSNVAITINMLLGMIVGGVIFLIITLVTKMMYGKDGMGLGDVKLMGALGLYFGLSNIIAISVMSFLIGAIFSIILLLTKTKKADEYLSFGPFIVISCIISIIVPFNILINVLMTIFTLGLYRN
ncbi:MAG: prepilin peptidase [Clostridia bacterium]|nr:prepilin peptidase [Clostridia bacterium]